MRRALFLLLCCALLGGGCSTKMGRVKGRLIENGQPVSFAGMQLAVQLTLLDNEGKPDNSKSYTAMVGEDGSFEVVASGGELVPGTYQVALVGTGRAREKYKHLAAPGSPIRREIKGGSNDLTIDLAKPDG